MVAPNQTHTRTALVQAHKSRRPDVNAWVPVPRRARGRRLDGPPVPAAIGTQMAMAARVEAPGCGSPAMRVTVSTRMAAHGGGSSCCPGLAMAARSRAERTARLTAQVRLITPT